MVSLFVVIYISVFIFLMVKEASMRVIFISFILLSALILEYGDVNLPFKIMLLLGFLVMSIGVIRPLRERLLTRKIFVMLRRVIPVMSNTEKEALESGTITWEGDIFSGHPNFEKLWSMPVVELSEEEQAFIEGPVNTLCRLINDWEISHERGDLSPELWRFIKENRFFGMLIPKEYGGLEFSATAQMSILVKLYGRSISVATTIAVPNSLGPAELLLKYGTEIQKDYYLPRLATGEEVPCFALTSADAGSDAASISDHGIVCYQEVSGQKVLGISLNWNKRYITLCPIATVIGLAFRLFDPDNILEKGNDVGISCALIPVNTPGVVRGRRHFPLNMAFLNGPTSGKNVFVPIDHLIGGREMAGQGWRMLMECLSAGRAISLPSSASGAAQAAALATGAYARIRKQFHQSISQFEGIEDPLARIAGNTYIIDSALTMAAASIDHGEKPSVVGAILKYHSTERSRQIVLDAMDIHGGKGICLGPNNYLGRGYQGMPIGITVEGANILSRNLIIFGQGAMRCHPYVYREIQSIQQNNLVDFDTAFWGHVGFFFSNFMCTLIYMITNARWTPTPSIHEKRYYQLIRRFSSNLAFLADFSMMRFGRSLKRKEKISARLGDILSCLFLVSAVLKRHHDDGHPVEDLPLVHWSCQQLFYEISLAIEGVIRNFPDRASRNCLKILLQPFGLRCNKPSDQLGHIVSKILTEPSESRTRLTRLVFREPHINCPLGRLEDTFHSVVGICSLEKKVTQAVKSGLLKSLSFKQQIEEALLHQLLTPKEAQVLKDVEQARQAVIAVDDFSFEALGRINSHET
jgi:acyl-CoA dehydrogenase